MKKLSGFTILETILALAILTGIILLLMNNLAGESKKTVAGNTTKTTAVLTNDVLRKFTDDMMTCQTESDCSSFDTYSDAKNINAATYLGLSTADQDALIKKGIDPNKIIVVTCFDNYYQDGSGSYSSCTNSYLP